MSELTLVIGNKNYSSWSLRAWLPLAHAGLPFREVLVALDTPTTDAELAQYTPAAMVPVLRSGDLTIWDSLAICEYVAEKYPDRRLWPQSREARAHARAICAEMHSGFRDLRHDLPMNCRARHSRRARRPEVQADVARILESWRDTREKFGGGGPFLFGQFTIADAFYAPVASRFFSYDVELDENGRAYQGALFGLPAMQRWMADAEDESMRIAATDAFE